MEYEISTWVSAAAYAAGGLAIGFGAIGAAVGEGHAASCAVMAMGRTPEKSSEILKLMLVGQAVAESASIFALVVAMLLLFTTFPANYVTVSVVVSAGLCMGLGAIGSGIGSGYPAGAACEGLSRQPAVEAKLMTNMLVGSAVAQTPAIFSLVISFILMFTDFSSRPVSPTWAAILGAGISTGLSAIGPGIGCGLVAQASCEGVARHPSNAAPITNLMLLAQAVTQTTAIYGLLISFILIFKEVPAAESIVPPMALLSAGICMGLGAFGPGLGEGFVGQKAVEWTAKNINAVGDLTRTMLVGQAVAESTGIYSLVISLIMIFVF
ncbi:MAG: ATP synthase F0 subunit C [Desulfatirhabdiaceae bacterium]